MVRCSNCDKEFDNKFKFCPYCGHKCPEFKICPRCEFKSQEFNFCPDCGIQLLTEKELKEKAESTYDSEEYEKSELYYSKALKLDSSKIEYQSKLEEIRQKLKRLDRYEEAIKYYDALTELEASNKAYKNKIKDLESKIQKNTPIKKDNTQTEATLKNSPQKSKYYKTTQILYQTAVSLEKEEKYTEAIKYYKKALELNPNNIDCKNKIKELEHKVKYGLL